MGTPHRQQGGGYWKAGLVAWLIVAGLSGSGFGLDKPDLPAEEDHQGGPAKRLHLTVRQGRLSADLWEADIGQVLARIGYEAGIAIVGGPHAGTRVSAEFMDMELEQVLRRRLRLASLSYAIRYAQRPTRAVTMQAVQVFASANEGSPAQQRIIEHKAEERAGAPVSLEGEIGWIVKPKKGL